MKLLEIQGKSAELLIIKAVSELDNRVREHFQKQDSSNQLLADATNRLTDTIETSFKEVLDSAVGRQHIPSDMVKIIIRIMGGVIFFLAFALIFALTGIQLRWFPDFHGIPQEIQENRRYLHELHDSLEKSTGKPLPDPPASQETPEK